LSHHVGDFTLKFTDLPEGLMEVHRQLDFSSVVIHASDINIVFKVGNAHVVLFSLVLLSLDEVLNSLIGDQ
jgi:hypothetical protein